VDTNNSEYVKDSFPNGWTNGETKSFLTVTTNRYKATPFVKRQITHWPRQVIHLWRLQSEIRRRSGRQLNDKVSRPTFLNKTIRSPWRTRFFKSNITHKKHHAHRCNIKRYSFCQTIHQTHKINNFVVSKFFWDIWQMTIVIKYFLLEINYLKFKI